MNIKIKSSTIEQLLPNLDLISSYKNVSVFCNLSPIGIVIDPLSTLLPGIPLGKEVSIQIVQESGSYITYTIYWDDGVNETIYQANNLIPVSFISKHSYKSSGKYTISIEAKNELQILVKTVVVFVQSCSFPEVSFSYGSISQPISLFRSSDYEFFAKFSEDNVCEKKNATAEWVLRNGLSETKTNAFILNQQMVYSLKKYQLEVGIYTLSLLFTYGLFTAVYNGFFTVVKLPLLVQIENGAFRSITYTQQLGAEKIHYNFTVSAKTSYDPDDPNLSYHGITFKWRCQLVSSVLFALKLLEAYKTVNATYKSNMCLTELWEDFLEGPELVLNTEMFLEGLTYKFEVIGTKGTGIDFRSASFDQEITFSGADLPSINLK